MKQKKCIIVLDNGVLEFEEVSFFAFSGIKYCGLILLLSNKRSGCDEISMRPRMLG